MKVVVDFVAVPVEIAEPTAGAEGVGRSVVLFEAAESDLVAPHGGAPEVREMADSAAGRLEAIAEAAEQVYRSVRDRLGPDTVEMEIAAGLSGEVGWFVAKSSVSGGLKLTLTWEPGKESAQAEPGSLGS